jgi:hypothetical protein
VRLPTASALQRVSRCPGSLRLPVVQEETEPAARGTAIHAFLAAAKDAGRDAALDSVADEHRAACEAIDPALVAMLDPVTMAAEVAYAYSLGADMARELGRGLSREQAYAGAQPGELVGTADLVWLEGDCVVVLDYKSGRGPVAPAAMNWQLRALALYATTAYNVARARVGIVVARPGEEARFDQAELDALDLSDVRDQLDGLIRRARDPQAPLAIGDHCKLCPSFDLCPAQHELLRVAVAAPEKLEGEFTAALSNGGRAHAYEVWDNLKRLTARLGDRLGAVASYQPIDLGDGRRYGITPGAEKVADPALVRSVLAEVVCLEAAEAAVTKVEELTTTKAAIDKALRAQKLKPAQRDEVLGRLRAAGALKRGEVLKEFTAGKAGEEE